MMHMSISFGGLMATIAVIAVSSFLTGYFVGRK